MIAVGRRDNYRLDNALAVVIAAGIGVRLQPFTNESPKCALPVQGKSILDRAIGTFQELGIARSVVIGGHQSDRLRLPEHSKLVLNHQYRENNILHSLAYARDDMEGATPTLVTYSDIVFKKGIVELLIAHDAADISILVDQAWKQRYDGRKLHPLAEAEAAEFDDRRRLLSIGKGLLSADHDAGIWGEFIGMMKLTASGQELFWKVFDDINGKIAPNEPFQRTDYWRQAYLTDLLQEMVNRGTEIQCVLIQGGWLEIDTVEDYERAATFDFSRGDG